MHFVQGEVFGVFAGAAEISFSLTLSLSLLLDSFNMFFGPRFPFADDALLPVPRSSVSART